MGSRVARMLKIRDGGPRTGRAGRLPTPRPTFSGVCDPASQREPAKSDAYSGEGTPASSPRTGPRPGRRLRGGPRRPAADRRLPTGRAPGTRGVVDRVFRRRPGRGEVPAVADARDPDDFRG